MVRQTRSWKLRLHRLVMNIGDLPFKNHIKAILNQYFGYTQFMFFGFSVYWAYPKNKKNINI